MTRTLTRLIAVGLLVALYAVATASTHTAQAATYDCTAQSQIPVGDCEALVALYNSTDGPGWEIKTDWLATTTPCSWYGITCTTNTVTAISLSNNRLRGTLPSEIGNLTTLEQLDVDRNRFDPAPIPDLSGLTSLQTLDLSQNTFTAGPVPDLSGAANLDFINLEDTNRTGAMPAWLGSLTNVTGIHLGDNNFDPGPIPDYSALSNLVSLKLERMNRTGPIPTWVTSFTSLRWLVLSHNNFDAGPVPDMSGSPDLQELTLSATNRTGEIPSWLASSSIWYIRLDYNPFDAGPVPDLSAIASSYDLILLDLSGTNRTGTIPTWLGGTIYTVFLADNPFDAGPIPDFSGTDLTNLDLSNTNRTGDLADYPWLGSFFSVRLADNNFDAGSMPTWAPTVNFLDLSGTNRIGPFPTWRNYELRIADNDFTPGPIPNMVGDTTYELDFSNTNRTGAVPAWLGSINTLVELSLASNELSGEIPPELANTGSYYGEMWVLDIGYNALTASDPALIDWLDTYDPDWDQTQTVAPHDLHITSRTDTTIDVAWMPIPYQADGGTYEIGVRPEGGTWSIVGQAADKTASSFTITGLTPGVRYEVGIQTYTPAHTNNSNELYSPIHVLVLPADGGFETSGLPNWVITGTNDRQHCNLNHVRTERCGLLFANDTDPAEVAQQQIPLAGPGAAGDTIAISLWVRGLDVPDEGNIGIRTMIKNTTTNEKQKQVCVTAERGTFGWVQITCEFVATVEGYDKMVVTLGTVDVSSGFVLFDDVGITITP